MRLNEVRDLFGNLMSDLQSGVLDSTRILFDLQQINEIVQSCSGCLKIEEIADRVTDSLVEKFDCALARLWLVEPDRTTLKLIASSRTVSSL